MCRRRKDRVRMSDTRTTKDKFQGHIKEHNEEVNKLKSIINKMEDYSDSKKNMLLPMQDWIRDGQSVIDALVN